MPEAPDRSAPRLILAFDFGKKRIGIACGDTLSRTATPLAAVTASAAGTPWEAIVTVVREWQPALAVVGLPYNEDGSESPMTRAARAFAEELARRCAVPVEMVDERYSSLEAGMRLKAAREAGLRKRRIAKVDVDAAAACVILERWISGES